MMSKKAPRYGTVVKIKKYIEVYCGSGSTRSETFDWMQKIVKIRRKVRDGYI
jgi:hypothetical protein